MVVTLTSVLIEAKGATTTEDNPFRVTLVTVLAEAGVGVGVLVGVGVGVSVGTGVAVTEGVGVGLATTMPSTNVKVALASVLQASSL